LFLGYFFVQWGQQEDVESQLPQGLIVADTGVAATQHGEELTPDLNVFDSCFHCLPKRNLVNNGLNYISTGAGFLPSTVL